MNPNIDTRYNDDHHTKEEGKLSQDFPDLRGHPLPYHNDQTTKYEGGCLGVATWERIAPFLDQMLKCWSWA